jgi:thiosulfate/3-mercaptopyruvate sulfurtransferase
MNSLVTTEWLSQHLHDPDLVVLDCTVLIEQDQDDNYQPVSGKTNYESGHIPAAGFADLMGDLADADKPFRFAVPTPEKFVAVMSALGVGDDTRVVLYDSNGSIWAARVWWMLRWIGFDRAALLDGGLAAWTEAGGSLSTEPASQSTTNLTVVLRPELIVGKDEVLAAIDDDNVDLVDALSGAQYRGDICMYDRPGHIPTAENVPYYSLVDDFGHYRPSAELSMLFGNEHDTRTINYCGGGIAASATAFVMTRLGHTDVAVYAASLQEWTADPDKPLVTGRDPAGSSE